MIRARVLIDAGPLIAMLSATDYDHDRCVEQSKELATQPLTCWPAVTEAAHLLKGTSGAVVALLARLGSGAFDVLPLSASDTTPVAAILAKYHDQGFDLADACLMHLAEREGIEHVFTLDRRHFSVFRTLSGRSLNLLPAE